LDHRSMDSFYKDPVERERWGRSLVPLGLFSTERDLVAEFFPEGAQILNIGCGGGREGIALAHLGFNVTAVDIDEGYVEAASIAAKENGVSMRCMVMDAANLSFPDETFDGVMMVGQMIGHVRGRENRIRALHEAHRVAKDRASAIFSTNSVEINWKYRLYFSLANRIRNYYNPHGLDPDDALVFRVGGHWSFPFAGGDRPIFHWYRVPDFQADLEAAGWRPIRWVHRADREKSADFAVSNITGETFHVASKEVT
jgi:SAM-dependent methyltransferase